jgi:hypothetical protein
MGWPRHIAFGLWQAGPLHTRSQTLAAMQRGWVRQHLPLETLVSEPIAYLDLHRQQRERVRALRLARLGLPLRALHALSLH